MKEVNVKIEKYESIAENENIKYLAEELIWRSRILARDYSPAMIDELRLDNQKADLYYFIASRDSTCSWDKIDEDIKMTKVIEKESNEAIRDIVRYREFKSIAHTTIQEENQKFMHEGDLNYARRELKRTHELQEKELNTDEREQFHLYPRSSAHKKVILHLLSYYVYVSGYDHQDPAHMVGQIILNEIVSPLCGNGIWSISHAISNNLKEYRRLTTSINPSEDIRTITNFVEFMLKTSLRQITYSEEIFGTENIYRAIKKYILDHNNTTDTKKIPEYGELILKELLIVKQMYRREVVELLQRSNRTITNILSQLFTLNLIVSDSPKGKISLNKQTLFSYMLLNHRNVD